MIAPPSYGVLLLLHKRILVFEYEHEAIDKVRKYRVCERFKENISNLICGWDVDELNLFICDVILDPLQVPL